MCSRHSGERERCRTQNIVDMCTRTRWTARIEQFPMSVHRENKSNRALVRLETAPAALKPPSSILLYVASFSSLSQLPAWAMAKVSWKERVLWSIRFSNRRLITEETNSLLLARDSIGVSFIIQITYCELHNANFTRFESWTRDTVRLCRWGNPPRRKRVDHSHNHRNRFTEVMLRCTSAFYRAASLD